jgi:hypothetical protein
LASNFGYKYGEKDKDLFGPPKIKEGWNNLNDRLFSTISGSEDYILQEDFLATSDIGLTVKSATGEILLGIYEKSSLNLSSKPVVCLYLE